MSVGTVGTQYGKWRVFYGLGKPAGTSEEAKAQAKADKAALKLAEKEAKAALKLAEKEAKAAEKAAAKAESDTTVE